MATEKKYVSLSKLSLYDEKIKKVITDGDAATLASANAFASGLASNYEPSGSIATAKTEIQGKIDAEAATARAAEQANAAAAKKAQDEIDALELAVGTVAEGATVVGMIDAVDAKADQNIADIDVLEGKVAALEAGTYDDTEVRGLIADNAGAISTLSQTHGTDKKALEDAIVLKADKTALDAVSAVANAAATQTALQGEIDRAKGEESRIEGLVTAEAARAAGVEAGLEGRLVEVETFFKTAEGETLDTALDTLVEIQKYVTDEGAAADQMVKDIAANTGNIAKNVEDIGKLDVRVKATEDKLAEIEESADANVIEIVKVNGTALTVTDKAVDVTIPTGALASKDKVAEADLETALATKINGMTDADELAAAISAERALIDAEIAKKVDAVTGKGLSTNDLTNELKGQYDAAYAHSQVAHAPADAQKNIIESVKVNGTALTITDKAVDIAVPTDNAQLLNGAGYLVASDIANKADKGTTLASYGIADAYTSAQVDSAIATAVGQFVEVSEAEINALFGE